MNDREIDEYISRRISDLGLTAADFVTYRADIYKILTEGEFDQFHPYKNLSVPVMDIVRYWWNNIADQDGFIDDVLGDILIEFKDRMFSKDKKKNADTSDPFDGALEAIG
jgi:hypothetical protein